MVTVRCSGATWPRRASNRWANAWGNRHSRARATADSRSGIAPDDGTATCAPKASQNLAPGARSVPHRAQTRVSLAPHSAQNLAPARFSVAHSRHRMSALRSLPARRACPIRLKHRRRTATTTHFWRIPGIEGQCCSHPTRICHRGSTAEPRRCCPSLPSRAGKEGRLDQFLVETGSAPYMGACVNSAAKTIRAAGLLSAAIWAHGKPGAQGFHGGTCESNTSGTILLNLGGDVKYLDKGLRGDCFGSNGGPRSDGSRWCHE